MEPGGLIRPENRDPGELVLSRPDSELGLGQIYGLEPGFADEQPELREYWHVLVQRRWTVLVCLLIVFVTVAIGTFKQIPIYQSKAILEIGKQGQEILNFKDFLQQAAANEDVYLEAQYKI